MNIPSIPFNSHIGIKRSDREGYLLFLSKSEFHENHLGSIHASALFGLAEASSGEFLVRSRGSHDDIGGVVRRTKSKYISPAITDIYAKVTNPTDDVTGAIQKVITRGKALLDIQVELMDTEHKRIATFEFAWLIAREG